MYSPFRNQLYSRVSVLLPHLHVLTPKRLCRHGEKHDSFNRSYPLWPVVLKCTDVSVSLLTWLRHVSSTCQNLYHLVLIGWMKISISDISLIHLTNYVLCMRAVLLVDLDEGQHLKHMKCQKLNYSTVYQRVICLPRILPIRQTF